MAYPPAPWRLRGQMYVTMWRLGLDLVSTAFVDYQPGGVLEYRELLFARTVLPRGLAPAATITEIWVDSEESLRGGRELWAIPKEMATFAFTDGALVAGGLATARFDVRRHLPGRLPIRFQLVQHREDGTEVVTQTRARAGVQLAHADWQFDPAGPLVRLRHHRPAVSVVLADFQLQFG
ncbi:MAG: acetoacetate decarboxylase [Propionibacteriales bacterium]|nr:acetoacetate decarboxylase [Propionibacteriales bacterium]